MAKQDIYIFYLFKKNPSRAVQVFFLHLSCLALIFLLILTPTQSVSAPISQLDLWKCLRNFLEDYSDGFIQYQSEQMWGWK